MMSAYTKHTDGSTPIPGCHRNENFDVNFGIGSGGVGILYAHQKAARCNWWYRVKSISNTTIEGKLRYYLIRQKRCSK